MKNILRIILPPPEWQLPAIILCGVIVGLGALVIRVSNAVSYFSNTPETCMNCHVMAPQYATWQHGSHRRATTCNDCHVPHDNIVGTYAFKAKDGMRHASMFTLRLEPQVIRIKEAGINVVQENCKRCHAHLLHFVSLTGMTGPSSREGNGVLCWHCHREIPHGRVTSLASTPWARVPIPSRITPEWVMKLVEGGGVQVKGDR